MGATDIHMENHKDLVTYSLSDEYETQTFDHNWLYITMVLLPQHLGDWHLDANWMVTHMTAKKFKHPIDYLYEKYGEGKTN